MSMSSKKQAEEDSSSEFHPPSFIEIDKFTSAYYQDPTEEDYAIARAFQAGNYNYIRKLPDQFKYGEVLNQRFERVKGQVEEEKEQRVKPYEDKLLEQAERSRTKKLEKIGTLGFFQLFPYKESPYNLAKEIAAQQHVDSVAQRKKISELEFRPSDVQRKAKYEDPFGYHDKIDSRPRDNTDYLFPFHLQNDTFNVKKQSSTRQRIVSEACRLAGPFLPSMQQKTLKDIHKTKLDDILTDIEFCLKKSMGDYAYIIGVNKKDSIEILFEDIHERDLKLKAFMSNFCENEVMTKYKLRRDLENWGILENKYILFTVIPPWVGASLRDTAVLSKEGGGSTVGGGAGGSLGLGSRGGNLSSTRGFEARSGLN